MSVRIWNHFHVHQIVNTRRQCSKTTPVGIGLISWLQPHAFIVSTSDMFTHPRPFEQELDNLAGETEKKSFEWIFKCSLGKWKASTGREKIVIKGGGRRVAHVNEGSRYAASAGSEWWPARKESTNHKRVAGVSVQVECVLLNDSLIPEEFFVN